MGTIRYRVLSLGLSLDFELGVDDDINVDAHANANVNVKCMLRYVFVRLSCTLPYLTSAFTLPCLSYTRSPLDSRLFGPSPWKVLAANYENKDY